MICCAFDIHVYLYVVYLRSIFKHGTFVFSVFICGIFVCYIYMCVCAACARRCVRVCNILGGISVCMVYGNFGNYGIYDVYDYISLHMAARLWGE